MAYPQGFLFPPLSSCPSVVLGPRAGHEGSAFAPYSSASPHVPYGGEPRAAAAISSFLSPGFEPSSGLDYHPFGPLGPTCHPYADPAYRKNATRDATATLKAWLNEHRKNPYPTKGEKIMLAIITKMTLTQVSTWFANARRRLKKENKMTWTPRNRSEDEEEPDDLEPERGEEFGAGLRDSHHQDTAPGPCSLLFSPDPPSSDCTPHCSPVPPLSQQQQQQPPPPPPPPPTSAQQQQLTPARPSSPHGTAPPHPLSSTPPPPAPDPPPKPKLWSLAEIATSSDKKITTDPQNLRTSFSLSRPLYYSPAYLYNHYSGALGQGLSGLYARPDRDYGFRTFGHEKGEHQRLVPP